jgi:hypothetical protein
MGSPKCRQMSHLQKKGWSMCRETFFHSLKKFSEGVNLVYNVQVALVICGLFIYDFAYIRLKLWHFRGTYPPIYQC